MVPLKSGPRVMLTLCLIALCGPLALAEVHLADQDAAAQGAVVFKQGLAIGRVMGFGRTALRMDAVESRIIDGTFAPPAAGDKLTDLQGKEAAWQSVSADDGGKFPSASYLGGYLFVEYESANEGVMLLEATSHSAVYANGVPRTGDPYANGIVNLPVPIQAGKNWFLFSSGRGDIAARLVSCKQGVYFDARDLLLPDLLAESAESTWGAVLVVNATDQTVRNHIIECRIDDDHVIRSEPFAVLPFAVRKVPFRVPSYSAGDAKQIECQLRLINEAPAIDGNAHGDGDPVDTLKATLAVTSQHALHRRTFLSQIDGSTQFYSVQPALRSEDNLPRALVLSLHGAGVDAGGQAACYSQRDWCHVVAATNRRPFGFDWEDWGRLDALEVMGDFTTHYPIDPRRVYLTGHSMGGHGTWQLGVHFPDRFAAIGPSAGWVSFASYANGRGGQPDAPTLQMLARAALGSETLRLSGNLASEGIYVLHGSADDNVPVDQARTMRKVLADYHGDFVYKEQNGAGHWWDGEVAAGVDCVDWQPMFEFFQRHQLPRAEEVDQLDFTTASPAISSRFRWITIHAQEHSMQVSRVTLQADRANKTITGSTENIAGMTMDGARFPPGESWTLQLDGQNLTSVSVDPQLNRVVLEKKSGAWAVLPTPWPTAYKSETRCGPFKEAFRNHVVLVYGTVGTQDETAGNLAKARYDAESFWYRGNGSFEVLADSEFDPQQYANRNVVLYGNADSCSAWQTLLKESPIQVSRGKVQLGDRAIGGEDLACLFVRPRPDCESAMVGVVASSGASGGRLVMRSNYFLSGAGYPDFLVYSAQSLAHPVAGIKAAGFFAPDWTIVPSDVAFGD